MRNLNQGLGKTGINSNFSDTAGLLNKYTFILHLLLVNIDETDRY